MSDLEATKENTELDAVIAAHKATHEANGTTIEIYLPAECPFEDAEAIMDAVTVLVYEWPHGKWDAHIGGHRIKPEWLTHE